MTKKFIRSEWHSSSPTMSVMLNILDTFEDKITKLHSMIDTTNSNTVLLSAHLNGLKENVDGMNKRISAIEKGYGIIEGRLEDMAQLIYETNYEQVEERMDNKLDALEKRLNDHLNKILILDGMRKDMVEKINIAQFGVDETRKEMKLKSQYFDSNPKPEFYELPDTLKGYPYIKLSIEQKKHICSAIEEWVKTHNFLSLDSKESLKRIICDTKVGEFIDEIS